MKLRCLIGAHPKFTTQDGLVLCQSCGQPIRPTTEAQEQ